MIKAIIFDMDGTILDTLSDLKDALNYALEKYNHQNNYDTDIVGMFFGSGIRVAFERALAVEKGCTIDELELIGTDGYTGKYKADDETTAEIDRLIEITKPACPK